MTFEEKAIEMVSLRKRLKKQTLYNWRASVVSLATATCATTAMAASYSWNDNVDNPGSWTTASNWLVNGSVPASAPGSADDIITPTQFAALGTSGAASINSLSVSSPSLWSILASSSSPSLTINKTLSVTGGGGLTIRGTMPLTISNSANAATSVTAGGGTLALGSNSSSGRVLTSLTVNSGLADIQAGTLSVSATTAAFNGGVHLNESSATTFTFNQRGNSTSVAFLSGGTTGSKVTEDSAVFTGESTTNFVGTLSINGSSSFSPAIYAGAITDSSSTYRIAAVQKTGSIVQTFSGANTYTGGTTISLGTLRANNNSAFGTGNVLINGGTAEILSTRTITNAISMTSGVLIVNGVTQTGALSVTGGSVQGNGIINQALTVAGATLSPGTTSGILHTGALTLQSSSTYSIDLSGSTAGTGYDQTVVNGGLTLGNGSLALANVASGMSMGTYFDIIKGGSSVTLASGLGFNSLADGSQFVAGAYTFRIDYDGTSTGAFSGGHDVLLTVVPEPAFAGLGFLALGLLGRRRCRK